MSMEIRVTMAGRLPHSEVQATIALSKRLSPEEDPAVVAETLRTEAHELLSMSHRRQVGPAE